MPRFKYFYIYIKFNFFLLSQLNNAIKTALNIEIVDDPLDAAAVHFGGGMWGVLAMPILAPSGLVYTRSAEAFVVMSLNILWYFIIININYLIY